MSNPYLAVLATPPGRERFGEGALESIRNKVLTVVAAPTLVPAGAVVAHLMNTAYAPADLSLREADDMIKAGQVPRPFADQQRRSGQRFTPALFNLQQRHIGAPLSVADASVKTAYLLGVLSRYTLDRRFADEGERLINRTFDTAISSDRAQSEKDPAKIAELYDGVLQGIGPFLKGREGDPGVKHLLSLMGRQGARDAVSSAQSQDEARKIEAMDIATAGGSEKRQDSCFETPEAREGHTKWEAMVPAFLREPDPKATPPGCKTRLKPWVAPTGIGVGVGLVALLLFRRRRPQQTVVMIPSSSSSSAPAPAPANR